MKISLKWLNDYIDIQEYFKKPDSLADILTKAGLEIESIDNKFKQYDHVLVGLILEKDRHPNADRLSLCRVTTGQGIVHQIVCGAQNHKEGDRVIVALPGAVLPGDFSIQKSVIRGVESYGMLCSYKELGFAQNSEGIAILPSNTSVGQSFVEYYGMDDIIFEIKVTPNRADVLSHFGLARELSCLLNKELKTNSTLGSSLGSASGNAIGSMSGLESRENFFSKTASTKQKIDVVVEDTQNCLRYTGRYISNVKVGTSPEWLVKKLEVLGLKSINNIVDITNYILQDLGQPLHAFDADKIESQKLVIGLPEKYEKFVTLDGTELILTGEELSIKDGSGRTLCLAGLIGGKNSGVSDQTKNIFIESACFKAHSVRKTSRVFGIDTDSGYRFSRGVDSELTKIALDKASKMIQEMAEGEVFSDEYDIYPAPLAKKSISVSVQTVSERLGYECEAEVFENWMRRLGCEVATTDKKNYEVTPPSFRFDIEMDMDLVEEYARLQGYDKIPETLPALSDKPTAHSSEYLRGLKSASILKSRGFSQAFNYSFVGDNDYKAFFGDDNENLFDLGIAKTQQVIRLMNPLNADLNILRPTIVYGLYKNAITNIRYGNESGRLFEIGKVFYIQSPSSEATTESTTKKIEESKLGLIAWGDKQDLWKSTPQAPPIFSLKESIEKLLKLFRVKSFSWEQINTKSEGGLLLPQFCHPYRTAYLKVEGRVRGFITTLHPLILENEKIRVPMALGEFQWSLMLPEVERSYRVSPVSRFPFVERDLSLVMNKRQPLDRVYEIIKKVSASHLMETEIFDIFEGDKLPPEKRCVSLRLKFQDLNITLEESTVSKYIEQIVFQLNEHCQITLR